MCRGSSKNRAALSCSARRYDLAVCCSKMSFDAVLSEALYEADKVLEKFAAEPWECAKWRTEQTVNRKCMFYFVILHNMSINSLHLCLRLLCRLLHCCKQLSKYTCYQQWSRNTTRHRTHCGVVLCSALIAATILADVSVTPLSPK